MGKKNFQAGQLIPTSSTPPGNAGFYRIDKNTIGVVGNLVQKNANTNVESNVSTGANLAAELAAIGLYQGAPTIKSVGGLPKLLPFGCSIAQQCNAFAQTVTSTMVVGDVKAGATSLTVLSGAGFTTGHKITVPLYNARMWTVTLSGVAGAVLSFTTPTPGLIRSASTVTDHTGTALPSLNLGYGAINAATALLGGPVEVLPAYGYGGAICNEMLIDLERDLRFYHPQVVALHMLENDLTGSVASGSATVAQLKGWLRQCAILCLSYGATPLIYSSMPYYNSGSGVGIPAARAADYDELAAYIGSGTSGQLSRDVPGTYGDNSVSTGWLDTSNPTWPRAPLAGWTDGVHPNTAYRFAVGMITKAVMAQVVGSGGSWLDYCVSHRQTSNLEGTGGTASNLQPGSIAPSNHTCVTYTPATTLVTTSRNADQSLKVSITWPTTTSRNVDIYEQKFTVTPRPVWIGGTQRFKAYTRLRINAKNKIAQIFPHAYLSTGEYHTGATGVDMCESMPADGSTILLETNVFSIGIGATSVVISVLVKPTTSGSPSGCLLDMDILELGLVPCTPETPHDRL